MPDETDGRFLSLRAAMDRGQDGHPTPQEALHFLLSSHPLAPGLLSEARHRAVLARNSAAAASLAIRRARDAELGYEHARRAGDPRGSRRGRFWPTAGVIGLLLAVAAAAAYVLCLAVPWPARMVLTAATLALGGAVAYAHRGGHARRRLAAGLTAAAGLLCVALVALRVVTHTLAVLPLIEAAALGAVLAMAIAAAVLAADRCETLACCRARQLSEDAASVRDRCADAAFADQAEAVAAAGHWESLVVEECRLMRPPAAEGEQWVTECVRIARLSAAPAD